MCEAYLQKIGRGEGFKWSKTYHIAELKNKIFKTINFTKNNYLK